MPYVEGIGIKNRELVFKESVSVSRIDKLWYRPIASYFKTENKVYTFCLSYIISFTKNNMGIENSFGDIVCTLIVCTVLNFNNLTTVTVFIWRVFLHYQMWRNGRVRLTVSRRKSNELWNMSLKVIFIFIHPMLSTSLPLKLLGYSFHYIWAVISIRLLLWCCVFSSEGKSCSPTLIYFLF